jgi:hypothetical protein
VGLIIAFILSLVLFALETFGFGVEARHGPERWIPWVFEYSAFVLACSIVLFWRLRASKHPARVLFYLFPCLLLALGYVHL